MSSRRDQLRRWLLILPVWVVIILCSGLPLMWMVWQIARNPAVLAEVRLDHFRLALLGRTLAYNGAAALIATLIALPAAFVLGRGKGFLSRALWFALPISLLLPSIIYAYGWSQFFRLIAKPLASVLLMFLTPDSPALAWLGIAIQQTPSGNLASFIPGERADIVRCIWTLATWLWALPAALIGLSLRRMDTQIQQQAMLDGALGRITLRYLAAPIVASLAIAAILAVQEFAVYEPSGISVVATEVRMVFDTGAFSSPENPITAPISGSGGLEDSHDQRARAAAALATTLPLLAVIAVLCIFAALTTRHLSAAEEIDIGPWPQSLHPAKRTQSLAAIVIIITAVVPLLSLIFSLHRADNPAYIWREFSPQTLGAQFIGALTAAAALALMFFETLRKSALPLILSVLTFLIGGQLIAIAQIRIYNRPWLNWIYNAAPIMVIAYLSRFGWIALLAARSTWSRQWKTLRDLAAIDGAEPLAIATRVIWPIAWPMLLAAAILVMALSITEVPATVLISPQRPQMLTPTLMTWVHMLRYDAMIEASLVLVGTVIVLASLAVLLTRAMVRSRRVSC